MSSLETEEALARLSVASLRLHPDDIASTARAVAAGAGLHDLVVYFADLEQRSLVPVPFSDESDVVRASLAIDGTIAGRAYRSERPVVVPPGDEPGAAGRAALWFPLLDSAERLGVIHAMADRSAVDEEHLVRWAAYVSLVGEVFANKMAYGDLLTNTRRVRPLSLSAEMRWSMLPPLTFTGRNLAISGVLLPAYTVAGDTFDYAVNGNFAHVAILDAVGHGLEAARIANLAISAYRNGRRAGHDTPEIYRAMDAIVIQVFGQEKFATAQLATLNLSSGCLRWLNAGHPPPMVIRRGHRIDLESTTWLPVGLGGPDASLTETSLEPGDVVLFFTDGITEARSATGSEFGRERLADFIERAVGTGQTSAETVRLLSLAVLGHQNETLQDDATLLLLSWTGPAPAGL
jgi:hypothetical protein